jgi:Ribonuclease G/E
VKLIYDINYLKGYEFVYHSKDTSKTTVRLAAHAVVYQERGNNTAQLIGIDYTPMRDVDLTADRKDTINVYFTDPYYDPDKKLQIEYSVFECE